MATDKQLESLRELIMKMYRACCDECQTKMLKVAIDDLSEKTENNIEDILTQMVR